MPIVERMPWGKYRGYRLDDIESSYLCWCLDHAARLRPSLRTAITAELASRFGAPPPPPPPSSSSRWRPPCPDPALAADVVAAGLRSMAKRCHPDVGGDTTSMQQLNAVIEWLRNGVGVR